MYEYKAKLIRAIDGDTVEVMIDLGCDIHFKTIVRLFGINAPEKKGETLRAATNSMLRLDYLLTIASNKERLFIQTIKDKEDKYGRLLGILFESEPSIPRYIDFEHSINDQMVREGWATRAPSSWNK